MALITSDSGSVGWSILNACIVQTPVFSTSLSFSSFDWTNLDDALALTNAIIERCDATGYDAASVVTPSDGSDLASLASTWAALQSCFVTAGGDDSAISNAVHSSRNNAASDYESWVEYFYHNEKVGDDAFEAFCLTAGLTDGAGNWGFRYATQIDEDGDPIVQYPNSSRVCTADDLFMVPELLDDLITAAQAITAVKWSHPASIITSRKFAWSNNGDETEGFGGNFSGGTSVISTAYNGSNLASLFTAAQNDFENNTPSTSTAAPEGIATTDSSLYITDSDSDIYITLSSTLIRNAAVFTPSVGGTYKLHAIARVHDDADSFDDLGSGLSTTTWTTVVTGSATGGASTQTSDIGAASMLAGDFPAPGEPSFTINVTVTASPNSGSEPLDVTATVEADVASIDITTNAYVFLQWDLDGTNGNSGVTTEDYSDLAAGSYTTRCKVYMYKDTDGEVLGQDTDDIDVETTTTTTTTSS